MVGEYLVSAWEENKTMWQIYRWFDGSYLCKSGGRRSYRKFEGIAREYDMSKSEWK